MRAEFSEYSYGLAITYEVIERLGSTTGMRAAPIMPSLRAERTGGYDLHIDSVYAGIFLQFKRPDYLVGSRAAERTYFGGDYYRFELRNTSNSPQHSVLCALQNRRRGYNDWVGYAAAAFWSTIDLNHAFNRNAVCDRSIFIPPQVIGDFPVGTWPAHSIAYTGQHDACCFSEPRPLETTSWSAMQTQIVAGIQNAAVGIPIRTYLLNLLLGLGQRADGQLPLNQQVAAVAALALGLNVQIILIGLDSTEEG